MADITRVMPPTQSSISAYESSGEPVTLSWSGAAPGVDNNIAGYELQSRNLNGEWETDNTIITTETGASSDAFPSATVGVYRQFRIRTLGDAGGDYNSVWYECPYPLLRIAKDTPQPEEPDEPDTPDTPGGEDTPGPGARPQDLPDITLPAVSLSSYRSSSTSNDWSKTSKTATFEYTLPDKATITGYTLKVQVTQSGEILRAGGKNLMSGSNTVTLPVAAGMEHANSLTILFEYKPWYQAAATSTVSTTYMTPTLTVHYVMDYTPCTAPTYSRLMSGQSAGEPVQLEWSGALGGKDNAITGYIIQQRTDAGQWSGYTQVPSTASADSVTVYPPDKIGSMRYFRIATMGSAGSDYYSEWHNVAQPLMRVDSDVQQAEDVPIKLPRLMDRNLNEIRRLHPSSVELTLNLSPLSEATIIVPDDDEIAPRQFVEIYKRRGSAGIYQVQRVEHNYDDGTITAHLSHGLCTLADAIVMMEEGEETGAAIGTFGEVITQLLDLQTAKTPGGNIPYWQLGVSTVSELVTAVYTYNNENLLSAITGLRDQAGTDYVWQFDQSTLPWRISLVNASSTICEGRLTRNVASAKVTMDTSDMCTRLYPYGMGEGKDRITLKPVTDDGVEYLDADTKPIYGEIVQTFVLNEVYESSVLKSVAESYLDRHKDPAVTVDIGAIDLSMATGEPLDLYEIGQMYRLPLPGYDTTIVERIVSMEWNDLLGNPDDINLTLANKSQEASDELADLIRKSTAAPLVGGKVQEHKFSTSYPTWGGDYVVLRFNVDVYPAILSIKLDYSLSYAAHHRLLVDSVDIDSSNSSGRTMDIAKYLTRDEAGSLTGAHTVSIYVGDSVWDMVTVKINVTLKTVEK